jgi:hypothetical protein
MLNRLLFGEFKPRPKGLYLPILTVVKNRKGVIDVDTVKGCTLGMRAYPDGGCYGECYAYKTAKQYGLDFSTSVSRKIADREHMETLTRIMQGFTAPWYRVGTAGDPCHDWNNAVVVCRALRYANKIPVIITKHWLTLSDEQILQLKKLSAVFNTSVSGMDTDAELTHRICQASRIKQFGLRSILRIVTCNYGVSNWAKSCNDKQRYLFSLGPFIDNPFRATSKNARVIGGDIIMRRVVDAVGGGKFVSLHNDGVYLGTCPGCPDQCGVDEMTISNKTKEIPKWN